MNSQEFINEVTPNQRMTFNVKKWKNIKEVRDYLYAQDFDMLGHGVFAEVWQSPGKDKVVKISTAKDECWIRYVNWVQKQGNNKYLPKIYSFREYEFTYRNRPQTHFIAVIEVLQESDSLKQQLRKSIKDNPSLGEMAMLAWLSSIGWDGSWHFSVGHLMKNSPLLNSDPRFKNLDWRQRAEKLVQNFKRTEFARTAEKVERELAGNGCVSDLHFGNVMWRPSTKNLVITDPLATAMSGL